MKNISTATFSKAIGVILCVLQCLPAAHAQAIGSVETASPASVSTIAGGTYATAARTLYIGAGAYSIEGTWEIYSSKIYISKDATFSGAGTIKLFNSSAAGGSSSTTFIDGNGSSNAIAPTIEIDNSNNIVQTDNALAAEFITAGWADVTGEAGVYVGRLLRFNARNGDWFTNSYKLTLNSAASISGYYTGEDDNTVDTYPRGYVVTNHNSGELVKEGIGNGNSFFFPIGRAEGGEGDYLPAHIKVKSGGPVNYHMNVRNFVESTPNSDEEIFPELPNVQNTWMIYANKVGSVALMEFIHNNVVGDNGYDTDSTTMFIYNGVDDWGAVHIADPETPAMYGTSVNYFDQYSDRAVPVYTANGFEMYYTKSQGPLILLPLTLVGFEATKNGSAALLTWKTEQEHAISRFVVERGDGFGKWTTVGTVIAQGGGSYNLTDISVLNGANYYRLKIIATDGKATYSALRLLNFGKNLTIAAYPNPVHNLLIITGLGTDTKGWLEVYDLSGKALIKTPTAGSNTMQLKMHALAAGWYLLKVTDKNGSVSLVRLMKQ